MIEFSGRMSRVFLKKIQLFFIFFEKTAKTPLPATMSTFYQHSAPPAHPPRAENFFREARNFSRRRENFSVRTGNFLAKAIFSPPETIFLPPRRIFLCRGGVFHSSRGVPRRFCRPEEASRAPYMRLYMLTMRHIFHRDAAPAALRGGFMQMSNAEPHYNMQKKPQSPTFWTHQNRFFCKNNITLAFFCVLSHTKS